MDLKKEIETKLNCKKFTNRDSMWKHLKEVQLLINKFELKHYSNYTDEIKRQVQEYRAAVNNIIQNHKFCMKQTEELESQEELDVLQMINQQIIAANINQQLLEKGTVKLDSLDYTTEEIFAEIQKANKKIIEQKNIEKKEIFRIKRAFRWLIIVCVFILCDKFYCRVIRPSIGIYKYFIPTRSVQYSQPFKSERLAPSENFNFKKSVPQSHTIDKKNKKKQPDVL